ncbi:MAG TPA: hypothetical protein VIX89_09425, partial [Bryobacteraceae bacterium]
GRTVSMQRSAGELITRATGAKQVIRLASTRASAAPAASSGHLSAFRPDQLEPRLAQHYGRPGISKAGNGSRSH